MLNTINTMAKDHILLQTQIGELKFMIQELENSKENDKIRIMKSFVCYLEKLHSSLVI